MLTGLGSLSMIWLMITMVSLDRIVGKFSSHYVQQSPGRIAQSVMCLATDVNLTADPGVASSIPARSHTFVEIDQEIISMVILLPSAESFMKGRCQLQAKEFCTKYWLTACSSWPRKKVWLGELTVPP